MMSVPPWCILSFSPCLKSQPGRNHSDLVCDNISLMRHPCVGFECHKASDHVTRDCSIRTVPAKARTWQSPHYGSLCSGAKQHGAAVAEKPSRQLLAQREMQDCPQPVAA